MPNLAFQFRRHDPKVYAFSFQGDLGYQGTALFLHFKCNKFHLVVEPLRSYYDACIRVVEYSIAVVF